MLGEIGDAVGEKRDLDFRGACIAVVGLVRADDLGLAVLGKRHWCSSTHGPERSSPGTHQTAVCSLNWLLLKTYYLKSGRRKDAKRRPPDRRVAQSHEMRRQRRAAAPSVSVASVIRIQIPRRFGGSGRATAPARGRGRGPPRPALGRSVRRRAFRQQRQQGQPAPTGAGSAGRRAPPARRRAHSNGTAAASVNSPLRVRRSASRHAPHPSIRPSSCANERT